MKHEEDNIQMSCVKWFGLQYPQFSALIHHSPNGGFRNIREAARFKAMGTKAGFADLILLVPRHDYHALFVEMKTPKSTSKQSEHQKEFQRNVEAQGYRYVVCRSLDDFMKTINEYLSES